MTGTLHRPAYYAAGGEHGEWRDWLSVLHPPYTVWHLSYVALGAAVAPSRELWRLGGTVLAFLLAVGVGAHALDEALDRPLRTSIPRSRLLAAGVAGIGAAAALGLAYGGLRLLPFVAAGVVLAVGYNLELFDGRLHGPVWFAAGWGVFPVVVGCYAQDFTLPPAVVPAAAAAFALSWAQCALSTPARQLRRHATDVDARVALDDGTVRRVSAQDALRSLETALQATSYAMVALAVTVVVVRF